MNTNFACGLTAVCPDDEAFSGYQKYIDILMHTILSPVTLCHILVAEEWKRLFALMDILYGDALKTWLLNMIVCPKRRLPSVILVT